MKYVKIVLKRTGPGRWELERIAQKGDYKGRQPVSIRAFSGEMWAYVPEGRELWWEKKMLRDAIREAKKLVETLEGDVAAQQSLLDAVGEERKQGKKMVGKVKKRPVWKKPSLSELKRAKAR